MAVEAGRRSDAELAGLAAGGDRTAFGELLERHYDLIFRLAYRWCGRKAEAEDVTQEVCLRLAKAIQGFRGGSAFSSWLYSVTLNAVRDWARKGAREGAKEKAYGRHLLTAAPAEAGGTEEPAEKLWAAVRLLPDKQREAVSLIYGEGMSHANAGELMGCAEATVSWHVHEAKKRLKVLMRQAGEEA